MNLTQRRLSCLRLGTEIAAVQMQMQCDWLRTAETGRVRATRLRSLGPKQWPAIRNYGYIAIC